MKTIEESAKEYRHKTNTSECLLDGFKAGVEFAERWIPVEEELPEYYVPVNVVSGDIITTAWRAYSEKRGDIYTISGTDIVLTDKVTMWKPLKRK